MGQASGFRGGVREFLPPFPSFPSLPLTLREETGLGQPGARQLLPPFLPWDGARHRWEPGSLFCQDQCEAAALPVPVIVRQVLHGRPCH